MEQEEKLSDSVKKVNSSNFRVKLNTSGDSQAVANTSRNKKDCLVKIKNIQKSCIGKRFFSQIIRNT